jgi:hypothetical protein
MYQRKKRELVVSAAVPSRKPLNSTDLLTLPSKVIKSPGKFKEIGEALVDASLEPQFAVNSSFLESLGLYLMGYEKDGQKSFPPPYFEGSRPGDDARTVFENDRLHINAKLFQLPKSSSKLFLNVPGIPDELLTKEMNFSVEDRYIKGIFEKGKVVFDTQDFLDCTFPTIVSYSQ